MKILFIRNNSFMRYGIEEAFKKLNIEYEVLDYNLADGEDNERFCSLIDEKLGTGAYDIVFSADFISAVSAVCMDRQVKYYSWVCDSLLNMDDLTPLLNECNEVFFFDRQQAAGYAAAGVNAHHLPLATSAELFDRVINGTGRDNATNGKMEKYRADVALVTQLFETNYEACTSALQPYLKGYLEGIIAAQSKLYGAYLIPELVRADLIEAMNMCYADKTKTVNGIKNFRISERELEYMLACEVTNRDIRKALSLLAPHCDTVLYSPNAVSGIDGLRQRGFVDYLTKMPLAFKNSMINLNISFKAIQSGIPLRVLDIMACGGFVLTNYQDEIAEYLRPGEACVMYESVEDMYEKASFYLEHDTERAQIAAKGRALVEREFTFESRIREMLRL